MDQPPEEKPLWLRRLRAFAGIDPPMHEQTENISARQAFSEASMLQRIILVALVTAIVGPLLVYAVPNINPFGPSYEYSAPGYPRGSERAEAAWESAVDSHMEFLRIVANGRTKDPTGSIWGGGTMREAAIRSAARDGFHRYKK